jgi:hypothetical protein
MLKHLIITVLVLTSACSKTPLRNKNLKPQNRQATKLSFEQLERQRAINTYRLLRIKDAELRKKNTKRRSSRKRYSRKKIIKRNVKVRSYPKPQPVKKVVPSYPKRDPEEIMIEVNQNLTYFCMQKRKSRKFKDEAECKLFTQEKLLECQEKHIEIDNARLVRCVKTRLRL